MHTVPTGQNIGPSIFSQPQNYFWFPAQDSTTGHHVEQLERYARLNNQWSVLASTVVDAIPATTTLVQGITELKAEIQRLKAGEGSLQYAHFVFLAFYTFTWCYVSAILTSKRNHGIIRLHLETTPFLACIECRRLLLLPQLTLLVAQLYFPATTRNQFFGLCKMRCRTLISFSHL